MHLANPDTFFHHTFKQSIRKYNYDFTDASMKNFISTTRWRGNRRSDFSNARNEKRGTKGFMQKTSIHGFLVRCEPDANPSGAK